MISLTPKQLKLAVTRDIARNPELAQQITNAIGFEPRWSKMSVYQLYKLQEVWEYLKRLTERED